MPTHRSVLVVRVGGRDTWHDLRQEILEQLRSDPLIELAAAAPVSVEAAADLLVRDSGIAVALLVGDSDEVEAAAGRLAQVGDSAHILAVNVDDGLVNVALHDPLPDHVLDIIHALVAGAETQDEAEVIHLADRRQPPDLPSEAQLPVPAEDTLDPTALGTLGEAMAWAQAATKTLVDMWSGEADEGISFGLSWEALESWLERMLKIRAVPAEEAASQYNRIRRMLADGRAAHTPLVRLANLLGGNEVALKLVILVLAPELDIRFQRLFGALHDDLGRRHLSLGLACAIIAAATEDATPRRIRIRLGKVRTLRELRLIDRIGETFPAADEPLLLDPHLLEWLVTADADRLTSDVDHALLRPSPDEAAALLPEDRLQELSASLRRGLARFGDAAKLRAIVLTGSEPGWIEAEATSLAGERLVIGPPPSWAGDESLDRTLRRVVLASRLLGRRLVVDLQGSGSEAEALWGALQPLLHLCDPAPFVLSDNVAWLLGLSRREQLAVVPLPAVRQGHRAGAVAGLLRGAGGDEDDLLAEALAERFRLPLAVLADVPALAAAEAAKEHLTRPTSQEWTAAFRTAAGRVLPQLARRVQPRPAEEGERPLDRVVLPLEQRRQLAEIVNHVRMGGKVLRDWRFGDILDARGVSALFAGDSGTGKTLAAHAIASELQTDLYVIDLANVVSKYIGETQKNLAIAFAEAERAGAVLLFDEADALFGKRSAVKDSHDRYANLEVADLLQRMELFDGLAILTSNHPENLDEAFGRRLRFTVDFPRPAPGDRLLIWDQTLPRGRHRGPEVDFSNAARTLDVTGGSIRQIVIHALMAAAGGDGVVRPGQLEDAARTELRRLGTHSALANLPGLFTGEPQSRAA